MLQPSVRKRLIGALSCWGLALAISFWLFSGESHVPNAGTVGSYASDSLVVVLIVVGVRLVRRAVRVARSP